MVRDFVSVVVPCYNSAAYIDDAILSLRHQTYPALEIVVVDDGSTDDSRLRIEKHASLDSRVRVFTQSNRGLSAARNAGLKEVAGEFVCFLDSDDVVLPDKVEKQMEFLRRNPTSDLVYSDTVFANHALNPTALVPSRISHPDLMAAYARGNWFGVMSPLVRRTLVERVGFFDESLAAGEDWDYWTRCAQKGTFSYLPGGFAVCRRHAAQMHLDSRRMFESGRRVIEKHFRADKTLYGVALSHLYWSQATREFRDRHFLGVVRYLAASLYHSFKAGGVRLRVRDVVRPVPVEVRSALVALSLWRNSLTP